jgi:hypothetical protein
MVEPDESVTTPDMLPRSSCARHNWLPQHSTVNITLKLMNLSQAFLTEPDLPDVISCLTEMQNG